MSIQSEITRLQNAKTAIKTAIENKGVTVPSSTKLNGYGDLVDNIKSINDLDLSPSGIESIKAYKSTWDETTQTDIETIYTLTPDNFFNHTDDTVGGSLTLVFSGFEVLIDYSVYNSNVYTIICSSLKQNNVFYTYLYTKGMESTGMYETTIYANIMCFSSPHYISEDDLDYFFDNDEEEGFIEEFTSEYNINITNVASVTIDKQYR